MKARELKQSIVACASLHTRAHCTDTTRGSSSNCWTRTLHVSSVRSHRHGVGVAKRNVLVARYLFRQRQQQQPHVDHLPCRKASKHAPPRRSRRFRKGFALLETLSTATLETHLILLCVRVVELSSSCRYCDEPLTVTKPKSPRLPPSAAMPQPEQHLRNFRTPAKSHSTSTVGLAAMFAIQRSSRNTQYASPPCNGS